MDEFEADQNTTAQGVPLDFNQTLGINSTGLPPHMQYLSPKHDSNFPFVRIFCEVYLSLPIAILGIIGNVLAFIVLCRHRQKLTTSVLLQGLAVADSLVLTATILLRPLRLITGAAYAGVYHHLFLTLYPFVFIFRLVDTWLTVLLTIDRFIAVCYPLHAQRLCTLKRTYITMTIVIISSFIFSIPRFFEFKHHEHYRGHYIATEFSFSGFYLIYKIVLFFLVMYLVPMVVLVVLNTRLVWTLRRANTYREAIVGNTDEAKRNAIEFGTRVSRSVTIIVVTVVLVCIICNLMAMTSHILYSLHQTFLDHSLENARRYASTFSNLVITINCAVNFAIYCVCSRNFRIGFSRTFTCNEPMGSLGDKSPGITANNGKLTRESVSSYSSSLPLKVSFKKTVSASLQKQDNETSFA